MRFVTALFLVFGLTAFAAAMATAGEKGLTGKELYKQNCRVCHDKGSPNGEYSPLTLIQDQWREFFKNKLAASHGDAKLPKQEKKLLETLTPEQIKAIQKFCVDHAADSEQPQTCS